MRKRKLKILLAATAAALMLCLPVCASAAEVEEIPVTDGKLNLTVGGFEIVTLIIE